MNLSIKKAPYVLKLDIFKQLSRCASKIAVEVESGIMKKIENEELNPRKHPGIIKLNRVELPLRVQKALQKVVGDYPVKTLLEDCKKLNILISSRHPPPEQDELVLRSRKIMDELEVLMPQEQLSKLNEVEQSKWQNKREKFFKKRMRERTFAWEPIKYGHYESIVYALARGGLEYGVLMRILQEIRTRDAGFKPQSYFDFGSGIGSAMWAASNIWNDSIIEYFNVDSSRYMNELSELILRDGNENQKMTLKNVFYRQFLPGLETKYDLVVSSYSLFELSNSKSRQDVIMNLWKKCDRYMIIVEEGSRRGFQLVNEAKDLILSQDNHDLVGHVFAPCPHDNICPRISNEDDRTPCNFQMDYISTNLSSAVSQKVATSRYSYVVLKKGLPEDSTRAWPRIVRPTLVRSKHTICRMCTSESKLTEIIFTQSKHGRPAYRCARSSRWGDRLPIIIGEATDK